MHLAVHHRAYAGFDDHCDRFRKSWDRCGGDRNNHWTPFLRWYGNQPLWCTQQIFPCCFVMIFWLLACIIARWSILKARPHYDRAPRKRSFILTVRPSVHTKPSRKKIYSETLSKLEEFENAGFLFSCGQRIYLENGALRTKRWRHVNYVISLTEISSHTNPKWPLIVVFLNSSGAVWTENIWCVKFRVRFLFSTSFGVVWTGRMAWVTQETETVHVRM